MYTQCFHCETVFQLTADTLRAAGGKVRCGRCGEVFSALERLAEDASAFSTPGVGLPDEGSPTESTTGDGSLHDGSLHDGSLHDGSLHDGSLHESAPGEGSPHESALEMEARADEILHSPAPNRPAEWEPASAGEDYASGDVELAHLQLIDDFTSSQHETPAPLRNLAPTVAAPPLPPGSAAPSAKAAPPAGAAESGTRAPRDAAPIPPPASARTFTFTPKPKPAPAAGAPGTDAAAESRYDGALEFTLPPGELDRVFVEPTAARARPSNLADAAATAPIAQPADQRGEQTADHADGLHVAEHVRRDVLAGLRERQVEAPGKPAYPAMRLAWGAAAAVLALALLGQMIQENRTWLAALGPLRGPLQSVYGALGVKLQQPVNLSAYQLRQWGVTGDPSAAGTLRVRASILNTSALLQPYPLLRVTLANRFGTHVGARDFEPAEYLGRPTARLMSPGERADATLDIQDPGKDAEGFEIDVCLRGGERTITCAADAATQAGSPRGKP